MRHVGTFGNLILERELDDDDFVNSIGNGLR